VLFNSHIFIFAYLPVTLAGFFILGRQGKLRAALFWLIAASLFFYGWWNPDYLPLIILSVVVNYFLGVAINKARRSQIGFRPATLLTLGVVFDLGLLGYYKYANFFVHNADVFLGLHWEIATILLPLAISFFTFTQIAYLVDAYHGVTEEYDFLNYAAFVTFFPHLIAGPIVSYRRLMPQFAHPETYRFQAENMGLGLSLFAFGLAKKVIIADQLAPLSRYVFDQLAPAGPVPLLFALVGALAYTFQLYFDFSAYSDMAIGLARMFNVQFPLNFNSPYKALDISDFWRRWHITLSHFLRDHLYIPLGGSRHGEPRRYFSLMCTMLLGGLWHGAGWTFVIWGGLHGLYLVIHRLWERAVKDAAWLRQRWMDAAGQTLTFAAVVAAWVIFRAHNISQATTVLAGLTGRHGLGLPYSLQPIVQKLGLTRFGSYASWSSIDDLPGTLTILACAAGIAFFAPNNDEIFRLAEKEWRRGEEPVLKRWWKSSTPWALASAIVFAAALLHLNNLSEFLYFRF
jgi:alginate O-acetyltransferase complex protein AlgI